MKAIYYILSVYILILSAIPCMDVPKDPSLQKTEIAQNTANHQHQDFGSCSPFCICNCCTSPILTHVYAIRFNYISFVQENLFAYNATLYSSHQNAVWQPPKLS